MFGLHFSNFKFMILHQVTKAQKERMDKDQKALFCSVTATTVRIDNLKNVRWWIAQLLRSQYRRLAVIQARFLDVCARLKWTAVESFMICQVIRQVEVRLSNLPEANTKLVREWLENFDIVARTHNATLDAQQESLLLDEVG